MNIENRLLLIIMYTLIFCKGIVKSANVNLN